MRSTRLDDQERCLTPLPPDAEALASILADALVQDFRQFPDRYHGGAEPSPWKAAEVVEFRDNQRKIKHAKEGSDLSPRTGERRSLRGTRIGTCDLCLRIFRKVRRRGKVPCFCSSFCQYLVQYSALDTELCRLIVVVDQERKERKEWGLDPDDDHDWIRGLGRHWPSYYRGRYAEESQLKFRRHYSKYF